MNSKPTSSAPTETGSTHPAEHAGGAESLTKKLPTPTSIAGLPWHTITTLLLALIALVALSLSWRVQQRVGLLEQTLVSRQESSQRTADQAQLVAKQSNDRVIETSAKVALLEARVAEVTVQRGQFEELIQSLSRSRDENVLVDIEAGLRVAMQQTVITGSLEPLVAMLKQSDDRLARYNQPRLEGVRRAIARDLEKIKAASVTDVATLSLKLDDVVRMVDDMPLLSQPESRKSRSGTGTSAAGTKAAGDTSPASRPLSSDSAWWSRQGWSERWDRVVEHVQDEARSLVRVTRIDHPHAVLLAPEEAFFLRENLKLRLLNARLALLSRQFETSQSDLQLVLQSFEKYFDRQSRRTSEALEAVHSVASQARQVVVPRPDNTLAALSALSSTR